MQIINLNSGSAKMQIVTKYLSIKKVPNQKKSQISDSATMQHVTKYPSKKFQSKKKKNQF